MHSSDATETADAANAIQLIQLYPTVQQTDRRAGYHETQFQWKY